MSKNLAETEGPHMTSQYGAYVLRAGLARRYARMRMHTHTRQGTHMHARTRKHAHTNQYVILLFHCNSGFANASQCYITLHRTFFRNCGSEQTKTAR